MGLAPIAASQRGELRQQVERDDIVLAEVLLQHFLGLQLGVGVFEAHLNASRLQKHFFVGKFAAFSASCARLSSASSALAVAFAEEICTAGDSPKKFGRA